MDDLRFDRLTRRLVLGGLVGGSLATFASGEASEAARLSKRKRCKRRNREFCAGRCCPRQEQCLNGSCVERCDGPLRCPFGVSTLVCGPGDRCLCTKTSGGKNACLDVLSVSSCDDFPTCGPRGACAAGRVCATCGCTGVAGDQAVLRCIPVC